MKRSKLRLGKPASKWKSLWVFSTSIAQTKTMNTSPHDNKPQRPKLRSEDFPPVKQAFIIRESSGKEPIGVRYIFEEPTTMTVTKAGAIFPVPEFGAMFYNVRMYSGAVIFNWEQTPPVVNAGVTGRFRCEVWKMQNGQPKILEEEWFLSKIPEGFETASAFVVAMLDELKKRRQKDFSRNASLPVLSEKKGKVIDHWKNAREVSEKLLREQYPRFFQAKDSKQPADILRKAFIADSLALGINTVPEESLDTLCNESGFKSWLSAALQKPGSKADAVETELKFNWFRGRYFCMTDAELEKVLNEKTGLKIKGASWRRKAKRFGLESSRKIGRPEKPNALPPQV